MKTLFVLPVLALLSLNHQPGSSSLPTPANDTAVINHVLDGLTSEWPDEKFETDKGTGIKYAIDNDAQKMFLALRIPDFRTQMKMMRLGMNLYIDLKGKKKEGRGIEFPVKKEGGGGFSGGGFDNNQRGNQQNNQQDQQGTDQQRKPDIKAIRSSMALNLIFMRLFGFADGEPTDQGLQMEGTANIAFTWDSSNVMHIEYAIPLKMLDENIASLNQKNISVGWKINGVEIPAATNSSIGNGGGGGRGGGGRGGGLSGGGSGNRPSQADMDKMMQEQSFWTKYSFTIPTEPKGF